MTGHIRRRGERSWEIKWDAGTDPATGRRKTRYASFKGTKRDAEAELVKRLAAEKAGQAVDPSRETVEGFLTRWDTSWASLNVSPKTLERYREICRLHISPRLGKVALQKLRPIQLSELYAALLREGKAPRKKGAFERSGLSPRSVGHVHRVLHRALGHAVQWGMVATNPASQVNPPPVTGTEIEILRAPEIDAMKVALKGCELESVFLTALGTGMRRGEIAALRWQQVDFDRGLIQVEFSLEETAQGLRFKAPKTKHGRRAITLPAFVATELRAHWKRQLEARVALGLGKPPADALVFCRPDGKARSPDALSKEWKAAAKAAGVRATFHALRHTHASQLIASGMDVLTISRRMGHGSPTITLAVYGHLFANTDDRAAKVLDAVFSGTPGER